MSQNALKNGLRRLVEHFHPMLPVRNKPALSMWHNRAIPSLRATGNYNPVLLLHGAGDEPR